MKTIKNNNIVAVNQIKNKLLYKTLSTTYLIFCKLSSEIPYNTRLAQSDAVMRGLEFHEQGNTQIILALCFKFKFFY